MPFHNRADELTTLDERWDSPRAELVVVFGRRRVGKSHLIAHFAERRRALYFEATSGSELDQLEDLSREIAALSGRPLHAAQPLTNWRAAFAAFAELLAEGPLLIALDEYQFVARRRPEVGSLINRFWREHRGNPNLMLVLAGSDVSFFEREVVGYAAITYGRRTASLRLEPFRFGEISPFLPGWGVADRVRAWAVFGGMPYYLDALDPELDLGENVLRTVLWPDGLLRAEPAFLLSQETRIRDRGTYMSALRAIASGATRLGEIAERIQRTPEESRSFLATLEEMRLVRRRRPVTEPRGRRVSYAIADPFLRFWFRFVAPFEGRLRTRESAQRHLEASVLPELDRFVSREAFEEVCQEWLLSRLFPEAAEVGRWWGSRRETTPEGPRSRPYEADAVAVDAAGRVVALGSCKWSGRQHPAAELDKLEAVAELLDAPDAQLFLFDRTGFAKRLRERDAGDERVHLVTVDSLGQ